VAAEIVSHLSLIRENKKKTTDNNKREKKVDIPCKVPTDERVIPRCDNGYSPPEHFKSLKQLE
jgi:adenine specific DNA methylase Mod